MLVKEATPSVVSSIARLYSNQEEADTPMILHASSLSRDHEKIIIQCDDTDVFVLLVYYFSRGHLSGHVYMYAGHFGKNRYIPVHRIANELGQTVCECSMNRIGKKSAYSKLLKNVDTLSNLKTFLEDDLASPWLRQQTSPHPCFPRRWMPSKNTSFEQNTKHGFGAIATCLTKK